MEPLSGPAIGTSFGVIDWVIVIAFLAGSTWLGLHARKFLKNMTDYVVASRGVKTYLGVGSMIASELGLVTIMYSAQKGFTGGFAAFHIALVAAVVGLFVGFSGFIVVPLRQQGVMTIPEFYQQRYTRGVRVIGGVILALSGILNMGLFLYADSLFVTSVMGLTDPTTLKLAMTLLLLLVWLYTALGGMLAVLVTDYVQFTVMAIGLVATSVFLMLRFGWGNLLAGVERLKGQAGFNPFNTEGFGTTYVIWMVFLGLVSCAIWQTAVIRSASAEDTKVVRRTYSWGSVGFLIRFLIPYFWGIVALIYLDSRADLRGIFFAPDASSETTLRAMPVAVSQLIPTGFIGLLVAAMLAAAMSTYNTYLHCWSSVLTQDVLAPLLGDRLTQKGRILSAQVIMFGISVFLLLWGLWYPLSQDLWDYMAVTGAIYFTGAFAVLVGGLYTRRASTAGAYGSFLCGLGALLGLPPVQALVRGMTVEQVKDVGWPSEVVGLATVCVATVVMVTLSLAFPDRPRQAGEEVPR